MPAGKITKYNPNTDMVAGRTASQIQAAKRKAVGGKKKRCVKGKSCSATCIAANKVCMVDIPWVAAQGIPKVVAQIKQIQTKKPSPEAQELAKEMYEVEWKSTWKKMNLAINNGDKQSYNFQLKKITDYYNKLKAKGIELGDLKVPKWQNPSPPVVIRPARPKVKPTPPGQSGKGPEPEPGKRWEPSPGFVVAEGPKPSLPSLKTTEDFEALNKYIHNMPPASSASQRLVDLIQDARSGSPSEEAKSILRAVGGIDNFERGVARITQFTGGTFHLYREAQKSWSKGENLTPSQKDFLNWAIDAERLLAHLPKESLVKYRGVASSDERLEATIAASKARSDYQDGALASWSVQLPTAREFAYSGKSSVTPNMIVYRTINKRGAAIQKISKFKTEGEVLTPASAQYRHTGKYEVIESNGKTYHVFDVIEK